MKFAASLAHHGLLRAACNLWLNDVDLISVPTQHMVSLASFVTNNLQIINVSGCDLVSLLPRVKCKRLDIITQSLGREETQALVQAMESGVKWVMLDEATLDMEAITEYSGQGVCKRLGHTTYTNTRYDTDTAARQREELRTWVRSRNWRVDKGQECDLYSCRNTKGPSQGLLNAIKSPYLPGFVRNFFAIWAFYQYHFEED